MLRYRIIDYEIYLSKIFSNRKSSLSRFKFKSKLYKICYPRFTIAYSIIIIASIKPYR